MAIFEKFPYTDLHNLNLDWMINQFKEWEAKYAEYDAELDELRTAVEAAQAALDQDEQDLDAAITRLDNAIQALPATIREVVRQEIYPAVEEQLPAIVDAKLPGEVQDQLPDEFEDWMDEHFTEPPIDPTMTMAYGVPSARAAGNIFDYLQGLKIEGYTNLQDYVEMTEDGAGNWDGTGGYEGASNSMRCHFDVVGGLTYRLSGWHPAGLAPTIEDIVFGQGPVVSGAQNFTPIGSILHEDIDNYRVSAGVYDIPIPKGADLLLVNSKPRDGHPYGPEVKGPTFEFKGGSELRGLSPVTGSTSLRFTDGEDISNALRYGRPVTFRFMTSSQFGELYASVAAAKLVREYDLWDIVMLSDNDQLIKARLDTSAASNGYLRDITVIDLGGDPGPAPIPSYSIVVNLTAGANNTFTGDITLEDLQSALDDAESVWLSYPGATANDYDLRQVVEYNQDLTDDTSLRIGVFSEDEYIVYTVVDDGNDGVTLTVVSSTAVGGDTLPTVTSSDAGKGLVANSSGEWTKSLFPMTTWLSLPSDGGEICLSDFGNRIKSMPIDSITGIGAQTLNLTAAQSSIEQVLASMRMLAGATVGESATRYVDMTGPTGIGLATVLRTSLGLAKGRQKYIKVVIGNNISTAYYYYFDESDASIYTGKLEFTVTEYDASASKKYVHDIAMTEVSATLARIYVTTTCTNFSSLM